MIEAATSAGSLEKITRKLAAYSLATGTGLVAANSLDAAVVPFNPGAPIVIHSSSPNIDLDINGDGILDYTIQGQLETVFYLGVFSISQLDASQVGFPSLIKADGSSYFAEVLALGDSIGPSSSAGWSTNVELNTFRGVRGYMGLQFDIPGGSPHFGYLDAEITGGQFATLTIYGGAYESQANTPILAGAIPEPNGIALLASGAAGLATWRRRRLTS